MAKKGTSSHDPDASQDGQPPGRAALERPGSEDEPEELRGKSEAKAKARSERQAAKATSAAERSAADRPGRHGDRETVTVETGRPPWSGDVVGGKRSPWGVADAAAPDSWVRPAPRRRPGGPSRAG